MRGAKLVAASDSRGGIADPDGLPIDALVAHKNSGQPLNSFQQGKAMKSQDIIGVDCDIWIPAARPDVINEGNVNLLKARLVLQGANIPATAAAEEWMHAHGILNVPDFIANSGGVICASVEFHGGSETQAFALIEDRIRANTREVLDRARRMNSTPRHAAVEMARSRVLEAQGYRRHAR